MKNKKILEGIGGQRRRVLAILASPRRHGNSETLLDAALSALQGGKNISVKKIVVSRLKIRPCTGCERCFKTGRCFIKDDMQKIYRGLASCDALIVSSPIYFKGLPCQLKCIIDRCQPLWAKKHLLNKGPTGTAKSRSGGVILVCATQGAKTMFTGALGVLRSWYATIDVKLTKEFLVEGLEEKGAAARDRFLIDRAVKFGENLI